MIRHACCCSMICAIILTGLFVPGHAEEEEWGPPCYNPNETIPCSGREITIVELFGDDGSRLDFGWVYSDEYPAGVAIKYPLAKSFKKAGKTKCVRKNDVTNGPPQLSGKKGGLKEGVYKGDPCGKYDVDLVTNPPLPKSCGGPAPGAKCPGGGE